MLRKSPNWSQSGRIYLNKSDEDAATPAPASVEPIPASTTTAAAAPAKPENPITKAEEAYKKKEKAKFEQEIWSGVGKY